jgi:hypothetical protein
MRGRARVVADVGCCLKNVSRRSNWLKGPGDELVGRPASTPDRCCPPARISPSAARGSSLLLERKTSSREMSDLRRNSPRRYFIDDDGRRVLIGLTFEETFEFERLDHLSGLHDAGHVLWDPWDRPASQAAQRWLELYSKHDRAWLQWMERTRTACKKELPFLN